MLDDYFSIGTIKPEDSTHENIINMVYNTLSKEFRTTYDYTKAPVKKYHGEFLSKNIRKTMEFAAYSFYCYNLGRYFLDGDDRMDVLDPTKKELTYFEFEKGGSCIYNSVVFLSLLVESNLVKPSDVKIVQGYYKHRLREDFPEWIPFGKDHYGMHVWSLVKKSIIDFCIVPQEERFFDFKDKFMIDGVLPEGLHYYGYEEDYQVVKSYADDIVKFSNTIYERWILEHRIRALEVFHENLKRE